MARSIETAKAVDGTTFSQYLETAEATLKKANKRKTKRTTVLAPGRGFSPNLRAAIAEENPLESGEDPVRIEWKPMIGDDFIRYHRHERVIYLNSAYRKALMKGERGSTNDLPILKALLYVIYEESFRKQKHGAVIQDNLKRWSAILNEAAREEKRMYDT